MKRFWHAPKGYIAGDVAFVACPCHLPVTLPLFIALTAGTAFGGWLANNTAVIYIISFVLFIGDLLLVGKWLRGCTSASRSFFNGGLNMAGVKWFPSQYCSLSAGTSHTYTVSSGRCCKEGHRR